MGKYSRQWVFIGSYCPVCHLWQHTAILESKCWKSAINWGHSWGDHHGVHRNICNQYKPSCIYHEQGCNTFIANPGHTQMADGVNAETFKQKWKEAENTNSLLGAGMCCCCSKWCFLSFLTNLDVKGRQAGWGGVAPSLSHILPYKHPQHVLLQFGAFKN